MTTVVVSGGPLTPAEVLAVARGGARVELAGLAHERMARARAQVEALAAAQHPVYGVSTGFGGLALRHVEPDLRARLQSSLVRSHAAGMGPPVEREVVRAMMLLRLRTLASGHAGVRPIAAEALAALLNRGITPVVPEHGSLGCSGDLAPLAHVALVLMGEGEAAGPDGAVRPAGELFREHGLAPLALAAKEGLSLVNGTDGMLGMLVLACADL
ncbi:MAG: histidine ammonia-lyase, partial [Miltoncostaeaceae bacterium]|nr:histidine ammonia-lyase [Miltoncostaeaceae bacterium]